MATSSDVENSYWAVLTLTKPEESPRREFQDLLTYAISENYMIRPYSFFNIRDLTPSNREPGRGSLRRLWFIQCKQKDASRIEAIEAALSRLPANVGEIAKLQYAAEKRFEQWDFIVCIQFAFASQGDAENCDSNLAFQSLGKLINTEFPRNHVHQFVVQ